MKKLEVVMAKAAKKLTELNVEQSACFFIFYQPQISENLKKRLKETR